MTNIVKPQSCGDKGLVPDVVLRRDNVKTKNPAYGRHRISRPMLIEAPIQKILDGVGSVENRLSTD